MTTHAEIRRFMADAWGEFIVAKALRLHNAIMLDQQSTLGHNRDMTTKAVYDAVDDLFSVTDHYVKSMRQVGGAT